MPSSLSPLCSSTSDLFINPCMSLAYYTLMKPPHSQPKKSGGQCSSFYDVCVADACAEPAYPLTHPAADLLETHHIFELYNE
ncbi:hypothetical protein Hypma_010533, partial [Hypsizygus marmoreus]